MISKGQKAMALAILYPEPEKGGRGKKCCHKPPRKSGGSSSEKGSTVRACCRRLAGPT